MNIKLLDFTLKSLKRRLTKKLSVIFIFTLLVFLLVSVFSIASSLKKELQISVDALPELIVQKMSGGRQTQIPVDRVYEISSIPGVQQAYDRIWGYYFYNNAKPGHGCYTYFCYLLYDCCRNADTIYCRNGYPKNIYHRNSYLVALE